MLYECGVLALAARLQRDKEKDREQRELKTSVRTGSRVTVKIDAGWTGVVVPVIAQR